MKLAYNLLPIELLQPGKYQPRRHFDLTGLQELAQSIQQQGLIEPLIVRPIDDNRYEIIAGERRWRAAMLAEIHELPCLVGAYTDKQAAAVSLIENIQRQDLNPIEEAQGYERLSSEFDFNQEDIALMVAKSRSHITNLLRLLTLAEPVQEKIKEQVLSFGHAKVLVGLAPKLQILWCEETIQYKWSVRQLEERVRRHKTNSNTLSPSANILNLQQRLSLKLHTEVQVQSDDKQGGWIKIKFFDNDTLAGLLEHMGLEYDEFE